MSKGLRMGDLVSVIPLRGCGACPSCLSGETAWCTRGMMLQGGGYAEYALTTPGQCVALPESASLADGALVEPLAVALHGVSLSGLKPADKVLVLGAGPIGLAVAFWARRLGASKVVVQDIADHQQERALSMGATGFVTDRAEPVAAAERALGGKADIVFECVGLPGLIAQAVDQVRIKGTVVILGLCSQPDSFVPFVALSKEVRLQTSAFFTRQEYEMSLDVLNAAPPSRAR
jgi:(R,R)-butanediol dehydrogenase/meso-butanediol dehydrogenase/diacetyl reductase